MPNRSVSVELKANVANYVAGMKQAAQATADLAKASKNLDAGRQQVEHLSTAGVAAGAAMLAGVALIGKTFAEFDRQMSAVAATGDDAKSSLEVLRAAALKAGKDTAFSATEAAAGVENLLKAGVSAKDVLAGGLTGSLNLAAAGELSVADAAETAAMALTQFHLRGSDVGHVADLLAAGAGKAQGEVSDLAMGLKQSGLVASQFGISIEDTVGTLSAFANAGLIGSDAGTSFKTMLLQLAGPSGQSAKLMRELGISAYDAQGKFVGVTGLAGQLQAKLGGLTQAQRNQAMAQIFGNDAIRAANVLYEQGASGLQKVIDQTNDAGYAARTAATRMDNLAGDWEKFTGSLETAGLQSGSGLNQWLRGATQQATSFADALGEVPSPLLDVVVKLAALAGGGLLAVSMLSKLATNVGGSVEAFQGLQERSPRVASGLSKVGKVAAGLAGTFAALQVVSVFGSQWQAEIDKGAGSLADMAAAAAGAAGKDGLKGLDAQFGKVQGRFFFWQTGASQAKSMADALKQVTDNSKGFLGGLSSMGQGVAGMVGQKTALTEMREQIDNLDQSLATMDPATAQKAFTTIAKAAADQKMPIEDLVALFPDYKATLVDTATQLGVTDLSAQQYADWMGGKIPEAVAAATAAHPELVSKLTATQAAAAGGAQSLADYAKSVWAAANAALETSGSQVGFERALDNTGKAVDDLVAKAKKAGKFKDLTNVDTERGRKGIEQLNQLATGTEAYTQKLIANGGTQDEVRLAVARARAQFIDEATAMGYSKKKAAELADARGLIPKNIKLETTENGTVAAKERLKDLKSAIKDLPKSTQTDVISEFNKHGVDAAYTALEKIDHKKAEAWIRSMLDHGGIDDWKRYKPANKTATITTVYKTKNGTKYEADGGVLAAEAAGLVQRFAAGGLLPLAGLVRRFDSGGFGQPQVRPFRGAAGVNWGEAGSGPWEAFISGAPQKRDRSIAIWKDVGRRLLGSFSAEDLIAGFASGGITEPTYQGKALSYWQDKLKSELELTRLEIQIRDLKADLAARVGKGKKRHYRLTGLDRTAAQQELAEAQADYQDALTAKKLNEAQQGTIEAQIAAFDAQKASADLSSKWQQQYLTGSSAADLLANMNAGASQIAGFNDLLGQLDTAGLSDQLMSWLWDQGPGASDLAKQILGGGDDLIAAFNQASGNLAKAADAAGQSESTGTWVKSPILSNVNLPGYMTSGANGAVVSNRTVNFNVTQADPYAAAVYFDQQLRYL